PPNSFNVAEPPRKKSVTAFHQSTLAQIERKENEHFFIQPLLKNVSYKHSRKPTQKPESPKKTKMKSDGSTLGIPRSEKSYILMVGSTHHKTLGPCHHFFLLLGLV
ncbi:hypothetical protein V8G54_019642, partial [Vigna mungo]